MMDFTIFILTHGRPDKQLTLDMLKRLGYTGKVYLVLDNQDKTIQQYIDNYGPDMIYIFDKNSYVATTDTGNNNPVFGCGVYARNAIEDIAKSLGLKYYAQADDDILNLRIRYPDFENQSVRSHCINMLDNVLCSYVNYLRASHFAYIGFGNQPTYICGYKAFDYTDNYNYPYAFMVRNAEIPVNWSMNFSDDYATPLMLTSVGKFCVQVPFVQLDESPTLVNDGGMSDSYKDESAVSLALYIKMCNPTAISITVTDNGVKLLRYGRKLRPKIISGEYKK